MTFNSYLKKKEFDSKISLLENNIKNFIYDNEYEIDSKRVRNFVDWNHTVKDQKIVRMIYPNEQCSNDLKKIVRNFIQTEFNGFH
ncbi:hypothetical protein SAMN04489761_0943 [Tenacibaculum sp. MAR_2009_124]|uniref:hypothetical protein n=1 Tax=Tenacibaculum sp. MAR_2009_124 TaxID=1250059 RepID=UPI00089BE667|nr:hypothetical protein [Tenacibaculum sp. MAR_2009_124]SEB47714.1 hypothetical protein SAMN04489761_0943 [Tenacibaculum sp. MAR_2009_124]